MGTTTTNFVFQHWSLQTDATLVNLILMFNRFKIILGKHTKKNHKLSQFDKTQNLIQLKFIHNANVYVRLYYIV